MRACRFAEITTCPHDGCNYDGLHVDDGTGSFQSEGGDDDDEDEDDDDDDDRDDDCDGDDE